MDINFNSVELNEQSLTIDGHARMPCLILQYDPPWDSTSVNDHYHYIPIDAIADAQITFGIGSDVEAVEFHVLNHAVEVSMFNSANKGLHSVSDRSIERVQMLRDLMTQVGNAFMEEARTIDVTDQETMSGHIFKICTEIAEGNIGMARAVTVASAMSFSRSNVLASFMADASGNSINKISPGHLALQSILDENSDMVEKSRKRVLDARYGNSINLLIGQRLHEKNMKG